MPALTTWHKLHYIFSVRCVKCSINWKLCWLSYHETWFARLRKTMKDVSRDYRRFTFRVWMKHSNTAVASNSREGRELLWPGEGGISIEFHHFLQLTRCSRFHEESYTKVISVALICSWWNFRYLGCRVSRGGDWSPPSLPSLRCCFCWNTDWDGNKLSNFKGDCWSCTADGRMKPQCVHRLNY